MSLRYESAGVNYEMLDAFKRACQKLARQTTAALASHGMREADLTRGESAYLIETDHGYLAHVEEGLGTKNLVADAMLHATGKSFYSNVGIDVVATIVNDLITTGALPISIAMHAAVGDAGWFADARRAQDLASGFARGCQVSNAVWGGGETPALRGIVDPEAVVLSGSAVGQIVNKSHRICGNVRSGDAIILLSSTGVHTNGLTLCRALADRLPEHYLTTLADGRAFGEALLDASAIYVDFIAACQRAHLVPHYAVHITGHGWRKLMRLSEPFVYQITKVPQPPGVFEFMKSAGPIDVREAYATFNMGAGFAVYVDPHDVQQYLNLAQATGHQALLAGTVVKKADRKAVEILPLGLCFESETLAVR
jgi:phosphoribosylformylglycinamidine cyclo-ligase